MIHSLEIILALVCAAVGFELIARWAQLPSPFLLLPGGMLLGFMPHVPHIRLDPDLVLYVFLPLLVYSGASVSSWVEFRRNFRAIGLLSVGGVLVSTVIVAAAAHTFIPGFGWATSFVLGAVVSPPDEVAAINIARRLGIPKGMSAILEGEGLVNDAPALTIYRLAIAAIVIHSFSFMKAAGSFAAIVMGETVWGLMVGWLALRLRRMLHSPPFEISVSLLTPFIAYLPAELAGGTGVLATAAAGLYVSYANSKLVSATTRVQLTAIWQIIEFILDGILFLVAGMQLPRILGSLTSMEHRLFWSYGIGVIVVVIVARLLWVFAIVGVLKTSGLTIRAEEPNPRWQRFFIVAWSGMRGAISLAAALSIPLVTSTGAPFPGRDLIIFLTFAVIVGTLLLQGLSLPWLIHKFEIDREGRGERAHAGHKEVDARRRATEASLALLAARRKEKAYPEKLLDQLEKQYRERHYQFTSHLDGDHEGALLHESQHFNVQAELIEAERAAMIQLHGSGTIDDDILRRIEKDLDLQELRLRQGIAEYELLPEERGS